MGEPTEDEEFFVGYLPPPKGLRRFALASGLALLALAALVASAAALTMRDPGADLLPAREGVQLRGVLSTRPYPILWTMEDGELTATLLVRQGKFGLRNREVAHLENQAVAATGLLLQRDGDRMLEIGRAPQPTQSLAAPLVQQLRMRSTQPRGTITVQGEIVDSKCYLGRMRPGGGRGHRACAQLCVIGGIPPVLVARDAQGRETHYLLASPQGQDVHREVVPYLAEPVRVTGQLEQTGPLRLLRIDPSAIERLTPLGPSR